MAVAAVSVGCCLLTTTSLVTNMGSRQSVPDAESIYDFTVKDIHGEEISLATYKDTVLLITNVASK